MSIYATRLALEDEDGPYLYEGSHILPDETTPRIHDGHLFLCAIPGYIARPGREQPDEDTPWPWLRLSVGDHEGQTTVLLGPAHAKEIMACLDGWLSDLRSDA